MILKWMFWSFTAHSVIFLCIGRLMTYGGIGMMMRMTQSLEEDNTGWTLTHGHKIVRSV